MAWSCRGAGRIILSALSSILWRFGSVHSDGRVFHPNPVHPWTNFFFSDSFWRLEHPPPLPPSGPERNTEKSHCLKL